MTILLILLSVFVGTAFAVLLYLKDKKSVFSRKQILILLVLRAASISVICVLLAAFIIHIKRYSVEKPIVAILVDDSRSIIANNDSLPFKSELTNKLDLLQSDLSDLADVYLYSFAEKLKEFDSLSFRGEITDISQAIEQILVRYEGRNLGGIILISDGIVNSGTDPTTIADRIHVPVYCVGLGDTASQTDLLIRDVRYNPTVAYGNRFPIEIVYQAKNLQNKNSKVVVRINGKETTSRSIEFMTSDVTETITVMSDANSKGILKVDIELIPLDNESQNLNNYKTVMIDVIDKKNKVFIMYSTPHPDITAMKSALEEAMNYEVYTGVHQDYQNLKNQVFDAVILYQLPDRTIRQEQTSAIIKDGKPVFFIIGQKTDLKQFNALQTGLRVQQSSPSIQETLPVLNTNFTLFATEGDFQKKISSFPPLLTHFGNFSLTGPHQIFLFQKIGNVTTSSPMLAFINDQGKNMAFLMGEGLHKWKLYDFLKNGSHLTFNEIIQKTLNLLVQKGDKRQLRVYHKDLYFSSEQIIFSAELYSKSMEMITGPQIVFELFNESGEKRNFIFSPQIHDYRLVVGNLTSGKYSWKASTLLDGITIQDQGIFFVETRNIEFSDTEANHELLQYLSNVTDGLFFNSHQMNEIPSIIQKNNQLKSIQYEEDVYTDLISQKWILFLLVILLGAEWTLRKYWGTI